MGMRILNSSSGSEKTILRLATSRESLPVQRLFFPRNPKAIDGEIYEALNTCNTQEGVPQGKKPPTSPSPGISFPHQLQSEIEGEMVRLYQNLHAALSDLTKKVVVFIGSRQGEGTSTLFGICESCSIAFRSFRGSARCQPSSHECSISLPA